MRTQCYTNPFAGGHLMSSLCNSVFRCGNYDTNDDDDEENTDYDPEEDLHMMFDDEDYAELQVPVK